MADYCSVTLDTFERENPPEDPLEAYNRRGYAYGTSRASKALDAAVALTASTWGPPMATGTDEADGMWWMAAYDCASAGVERAIVNALVGDDGG